MPHGTVWSSASATLSINAAVAALRFFFNVTLERPDLVRHLTTVHKPRKARVALSQEEVARLLEAAPGIKYKAALSVAYGAGLRVSEVVALKVSDIPGSSPGTSERMTLRVERGKGQRDRYMGRPYRATRRVPRLCPPCHHAVPLHECSCALLHRLSGGHRRAAGAHTRHKVTLPSCEGRSTGTVSPSARIPLENLGSGRSGFVKFRISISLSTG